MSNASTGEFEALGLQRDPFPPADTHLDFFARAGREKLLDGLSDLQELARPLVAVVGVAGVGKSTCFHALLKALPKQARVARVTAGVFLSARSLLQSVARAMGLAVEADEPREALRERLARQIESLAAAGQDCVVLVDDADELEEDALVELLHVAELGESNKRIRVMLFAEPRFLDLLRASDHAETVQRLLHEVRLEPYTLNELRGYLQFRLAQAGLTGKAPFTEDDYQRIYRRSRGCPGAANEAANEILRERLRKPWRRRGPMLAMGVAAALLLALLVMLLLPDGEEATPQVAGGSTQTAELPLPTLDAEQPRTDATDAAAPKPVQRRQASAGTNESSRASATAETGTWLAVGERSVATAPSPAPVTVDAAAAPAPTEVAAAPTTATRSESPADVDSAPPQRVRGTTRGAGSAPATTQAVTAASVEAPARSDPLLSRNPGHFTMQMLGTSSRAKAQAWIAQRPDTDGFHFYERSREGQPWFVVVYGDYADRAQAAADLPEVTRQTGVQEPWIRRMGDVQAEIASQ